MEIAPAPALTADEQKELAVRNETIRFYQRTVELLISERNLFMRHVLEGKGLDPAKTYTVDPQTGELHEVTDG